jgi:hypothetical protein
VRQPAKVATRGVVSKPASTVYAVRAGDRDPGKRAAPLAMPKRSLSDTTRTKALTRSPTTVNPDARPNTSLRVSALKLKVPDRGNAVRTVTKTAPQKADTKSTRPARSDPAPRDQITCKARPESNKPKKGGGSGKAFVPWCR